MPFLYIFLCAASWFLFTLHSPDRSKPVQLMGQSWLAAGVGGVQGACNIVTRCSALLANETVRMLIGMCLLSPAGMCFLSSAGCTHASHDHRHGSSCIMAFGKRNLDRCQLSLSASELIRSCWVGPCRLVLHALHTLLYGVIDAEAALLAAAPLAILVAGDWLQVMCLGAPRHEQL